MPIHIDNEPMEAVAEYRFGLLFEATGAATPGFVASLPDFVGGRDVAGIIVGQPDGEIKRRG